LGEENILIFMKTLIIINGVTGALGAACLARFSREHGTTIVGLSRQAQKVDTFCANGYLPDNTLICSIGDISSKEACKSFSQKIDKSFYEKIIYIHAVGVYPFELDTTGNIHVSNDNDNDGIDDRVVKLSHDAFFAMTEALEGVGLPVRALIFGGIADKFKPAVHKSWWTVIEKTKDRMKKEAEQKNKTSFFVLNISSVICPHELITRPFVFQNTNADVSFWLMPHEVAEQVAALVFSKRNGFVEDRLFHKADYYEEDYFADPKFTKRKKAELGI